MRNTMPQQSTTHSHRTDMHTPHYAITTEEMPPSHIEEATIARSLWAFRSNASKKTKRNILLNDAFVLNASIGKLIYLNRKVSMNINLNVDNILNNKKIQTYGYQQGRFDYSNYDSTKYPNKYFYAQGIKVYLNVGIRF